MLPWPVIDDHFGFRIELLEPAHELDAVDVGQHHVGDDGVRPPGPEQLFAARADERGSDLVAGVLEQDLQPLGHRRLVVDGQDRDSFASRAHELQECSAIRIIVNTRCRRFCMYFLQLRRNSVQHPSGFRRYAIIAAMSEPAASSTSSPDHPAQD